MTINHSKIENCLEKSVHTCLENMVFTEPAKISDTSFKTGSLWDKTPHLYASIKTGDLGELTLVLPKELLNELTEILTTEESFLKNLELLNYQLTPTNF